ncbi:putative deoxyguanosinetriphosphate triphosphohydrolase [Catenovulum agarivorans DS-2]|uniref:Putative deoxyguanosinetriphosphate triphosphohydrolase n=1 Tax=Catenovulum agarivorans DS-2 TaxID=1328313 RepID=W7R2R4_9ALTE|nr:dNTP triphosphohydrolase [Catenovulum agarivorans]EWH11920.1 putative deoxyguanosinetriphosphate triphosphohydrolase [Catenovulum agarivorans DS-2]
MLNWEQLLNGQRRKDRHGTGSTVLSANGRVELERDYDRILFATPTRRMGDKTQVFPLERNDSVRNRLTHSHEVSSLARSIGIRLAFDFRTEIFGDDSGKDIERCVPALLAAIGLAHDLGNPPFGHQGEKAIQNWFKRNEVKVFGEHNHTDSQDFLGFDGNAQTFRLVTRLQILNDTFGLNLTYATLASMLKYPVSNRQVQSLGWKKAGYFQSEQAIVEDVWQQTGLSEGIRHPFTFVMEACDDIAYIVLDAEDIVKKDIASFSDIVDHLNHMNPDDALTQSVLSAAKSKNKEFKNAGLSPKELNDVSMQMFRVYAISAMVKAILDSLVTDIKQIMLGQTPAGYTLLDSSEAAQFCAAMRKFDYVHGYRHKSVLELELRGNNYISNIMDMLWVGISHEGQDNLFAQYAFQRISENYRRIYTESEMSDNYRKAQLLADAVSGMTDSYLIYLHDELKNLHG